MPGTISLAKQEETIPQHSQTHCSFTWQAGSYSFLSNYKDETFKKEKHPNRQCIM